MARRGEVETLVTLIRWQPWPVATRLGVLFSQPCIAGKRSIPICMCIHTYVYLFRVATRYHSDIYIYIRIIIFFSSPRHRIFQTCNFGIVLPLGGHPRPFPLFGDDYAFEIFSK